MKKTLSILLVAAMLFCMAPVFGLFAAEDDFTTIDSAAEFAAFAAAVNDGSHTPTGTVMVTADLNMSGVDYKPINQISGFSLDFDGHTVSNINLTVAQADCYNNWHGTYTGLIANYLGNNVGITNLTLKDCTLTLDASGASIDVGGVLGTSDRGYVANVNLDNVKINSNAKGSVGGLIGCYMWSYDRAVTINSELNFEVVAPTSTVGILFGHMNDATCRIAVLRAEGTLSIPDNQAANAVAGDTLIANGSLPALETNTGAQGLYVDADNLKMTITGNEAALEIAEKLKEIDTGAELALLSQVQRPQGAAYRAGETIKVTADLDMAGIEYIPMKDVNFVLDFQGHVVKNLTVNVTPDTIADYSTGGVNYAVGMIASTLTNQGGSAGCISNLKLHNSTLNVDAPSNAQLRVGGIVGYTNRAFVKSVEMKNVDINITGGTSSSMVAAIAGQYQWEYNAAGTTTDVESIRLLSVTLNAPGKNAGLLFGNVSDGAKVILHGVVIDNMIVLSKSELTPTSYAYMNGANVTIAAGFAADDANSVTQNEYGETIVNVTITDGNVPAGDTAMVAAIAVAVIAVIGMAVFFKKRTAC